MAYMLDTNIVIHARDGTDAVIEQFAAHRGQLVLSALSLAELQRGLATINTERALRLARLDILLSNIPILPFDAAAALAYGRIAALCGWVRGRDLHRMIAAHAIATAATLVTNNLKDFRDIPNLTLENWAA